MLYAKSTGGFYKPEIHGDAIPADAVEITEAEHAALLEGQSSGKIITADKNGKPVLSDPLPPSSNDVIKSQIADLEKSVSDRRLREAVLTEAGAAWLADVNAQIEVLRAQLT